MQQSPVILHQFVLDWDLPNASPFCLKAETWLRLAGIPYEVRPFDPMKAPNGKAPYAVVDGRTIPDSSRIVHELTDRFDVQLDAHLTPLQRATALLVQRTLEEHTYFALMIDRWLQDAVWAEYRWVIGQPMPALIRGPMTAWLRRGVRQSTVAQGLGRHVLDEVHRRAIQDVDAVLAVLGEQPFVLGERPTSIDATVYAFFAIFAHDIGRGPFSEHCRSQPALLAYVERMREVAWSEPT